MKRLKTKELTGLSETDLSQRLSDLRSELSKLRSGAARGTLKKELGEIRTVRRNVARTLTMINAKKIAPGIPKKSEVAESQTKNSSKDGGQN